MYHHAIYRYDYEEENKMISSRYRSIDHGLYIVMIMRKKVDPSGRTYCAYFHPQVTPLPPSRGYNVTPSRLDLVSVCNSTSQSASVGLSPGFQQALKYISCFDFFPSFFLKLKAVRILSMRRLSCISILLSFSVLLSTTHRDIPYIEIFAI